MRPSYSEIQAVLVTCQLGTGGGGGGGGGGTQQSFTRGGSAPRSNPLPFYIPFLIEKGLPLVYPLLADGTSLTYVPSLENCIPLNCCNCPVFKIWINYKPERYVDFFHSPFGPFYQPKWQSSPPFHIPEAWKWYHFRAELPRKGHCGDYPPGLGITNFRRKVNFKLV